MSVQPHSSDDRALVAAAARGDSSALAALYDQHAPTLLALARHILGGRTEAEDLVHDVFLEAWRRAADYDPERGSVRAWLALRTRSRAIDVLRSARVGRTVSDGGETWSADDLLPAAEDAELAPDRVAVRKVLTELPEEQRTVLLLGYFKGLSSTEIAERTGVPVGTVKSRVLAALTKLRGVYRQGAGRQGGGP